MIRAGLFVVVPVRFALALVRPASAQEPTPAKKTAKGARKSGALFAAGAKVGKTLYISGKGDYLPNAEFPEKVENCLNEIRKTLQSAGLDMKHVVKSFVYLEDSDKYAEMNKTYAKFFPEDPPRGDARGRGGARPIAARDHLHRLHRPRREEADRRPSSGFPVQPRHPGRRHALCLGQGGSDLRRHPSRDLRGAGPAIDEERRDHAQAGRARLPSRRHEPRLPRQVREPRSGQEGL